VDHATLVRRCRGCGGPSRRWRAWRRSSQGWGLGLEVYSATVGGRQLGELNDQAVDLSVTGRVGGSFAVQLILTDQQRAGSRPG
jgi:hypothetical protein